MPPTHTRESVLQGSRDDIAGEGPSHLLGHHAPTVWACPGRGCGVGGAGCSARRSRAGREQGAGGRRSIGGRGALGGRSRPSVRRRRWRWARPIRRADALDTGRAPDIIERPGELGVRSRIRNLNAAARSPRSRRRLRACWATHGPVGWAVTPAKCTRRLPSSMTNSTYSRRRNTVSTVRSRRQGCPPPAGVGTTAKWSRHAEVLDRRRERAAPG
jgi:hypothetical protein